MAIVSVHHAGLVNHFIAIRQITSEAVRVADSINGMREFSHDDFSRIWNGAAVLVSRRR